MGGGGAKQIRRKKKIQKKQQNLQEYLKKNKGTKCFLSNIINKKTQNSVALERSNSYQNTVHEIYESITKSILHEINF